MTDKELHKLQRSELLEIMLEQSKEITRLKRQLALTEKRLKNRELAIKEMGSIAEASLSLTQIFAEAQKAADLYLENVERICRERAEEHGAAEAWENSIAVIKSQEGVDDVNE